MHRWKELSWQQFLAKVTKARNAGLEFLEHNSDIDTRARKAMTQHAWSRKHFDALKEAITANRLIADFRHLLDKICAGELPAGHSVKPSKLQEFL